MIRPVAHSDTSYITEIYNYYIEHTVVTFEETLVDEVEMLSRMEQVTRNYPWFVYEEANEILGYFYANSWRKRSAYKNTVESSIYLKPNAVGKKIGTQCYEYLIEELRLLNYHIVIGGITLPNIPSEKLHAKLGFEKVAHFKEVGYKFGKWLDVGYWQLKL